MDKIERIDRVLAGREVDRPPLSLWYHFGVQHGSGDQFARISLEYFHHYDFDFLKVMNDYFYPPPEGLDMISSAQDLQRFGPIDVAGCDWGQQFAALEAIAADLSQRAYFIDTVFDPWQTLQRHMVGEQMPHLMQAEPTALEAALDQVANNLIAYCKKSLAIGAAGIFMSVPAASEFISRENFLRFVKPPAMKVFKAITGLGPMNTAHIHGFDLFMDDCLDFPVPVFSWWDRSSRGPSLPDIKSRIEGCVMGGIDQTQVARSSRGFLIQHVGEGLKLGGRRRFFIANGCSIPSWTYPGSIRTIVDTIKSAES